MPCGAAIRWSGSRRPRFSDSTGSPSKQRDFARAAIEGQLNRAMEQRRQIREAPDGTSDALLREKLQAADGFLDQGRRYGDLVVSAFFAADNDRKRKERLGVTGR